METKRKKCQVIMLPTEDKHALLHDDTSFGTGLGLGSAYSNTVTSQHLYIISDDKIEEGDWFIGEENQLVHASREIYEDVFSIIKDANYSNIWRSKGKIIATTDKSLKVKDFPELDNSATRSLPQPSQAFIEKYCKLGGIDEVDIEYEYVKIALGGTDLTMQWQLKVNCHNEIDIYSIKDSWSREEVEKLCRNAMFTGELLGKSPEKQTPLGKGFDEISDNWVKENL